MNANELSTPVSNDFARGFQAAADIVAHVEKCKRTGLHSLLSVTVSSPQEALEAYGKTIYVPQEGQ